MLLATSLELNTAVADPLEMVTLSSAPTTIAVPPILAETLAS